MTHLIAGITCAAGDVLSGQSSRPRGAAWKIAQATRQGISDGDGSDTYDAWAWDLTA